MVVILQVIFINCISLYDSCCIFIWISRKWEVLIGQIMACLRRSDNPLHEPPMTQFSDELYSWWRHQMETFSALLAICAGNSLVPGEFPAHRSVTRSFDVFFDLRPKKRLIKQWRGWWFETLSRPLWRHCNVVHPRGNRRHGYFHSCSMW